MKAPTVLVLWLACLLGWVVVPATALPLPVDTSRRQAPEATAQARPLLEELRETRLDPAQAFQVTDLFLRRDAVRLHLRHGTLVFFRPVKGRVTGAVFEGAGEALVLPPDALERQQLAKFTGSPILTESFSSAYFRFSDNTFAELREQVGRGRGRRTQADEVVEEWNPLLEAINNAHSLRLLLDFLEPSGHAYFYAGLQGEHLGSFDIIVDDRRPEPLLIGQLRRDKTSAYYNVWSSFRRRATALPPPTARATAYRIRATLHPDYRLEAVCELDLEFLQPGRRTLLFQLSRLLTVEQVTQVLGSPEGEQPLEFFQNVALSEEEARYRGSDVVLVTLPVAAEPSHRHTLRFRYQGHVIADVGGGVLFVRARDIWYPSLDVFSLADYELRFRYPRRLELVAAGRLREVHTDGDWKEGVWVTDVPVAVAGFNIGRYQSYQVPGNGRRVVVYANQQIEPEIMRRLRAHESTAAPSSPATPGSRAPAPAPETEAAPPQPDPQQVGREVKEALATFTRLFGPVPYSEIKVSPIPARFAQGYPGLIYLSTYSFLRPLDQQQLGLGLRSREHFTRLTPAHEAAHQWWGNWVTSPDYRDQWLMESLAAYSALLHLEQPPGGPAAV
ncbi:MAG: M1 family aminopeptidase, partial [Terriglobia bacterium]